MGERAARKYTSLRMVSEDGSPGMDDGAAFDLDPCREMGFDELARFVEDSLGRVFAPDPDGERPRREGEFRQVWEVLREKYEAQPEEPAPPPPPLPPPRDPLEAAHAKRVRTERLLKNAPGDPTVRKKDVRQMELTLKRLDREIREMEASGEYGRYLPPAELPAPEPPRPSRYRTLYTLLGKIERTFHPEFNVSMSRSPWRLIPPTELTPGGTTTSCNGGVRASGTTRTGSTRRSRSSPTTAYGTGRASTATSSTPSPTRGRLSLNARSSETPST